MSKDDADSAAARILADFAAKPVVLAPGSPLVFAEAIPCSPSTPQQQQQQIVAGSAGVALVPSTSSASNGSSSDLLLRTPSQATTLVEGTPNSALSRRTSSSIPVKKRGPVSKLDGAYFPHKLYRIISSGSSLRWVDEYNFMIVSYEQLLQEWRELVNDIKEQTMKDELRKHNFIRNRKMEKERGGQGGEIWYHRESLFQQGKEHLLDEIKRKYRSAKKIKPVDEGPDLMAVTSSASDMQIPGNVASVEAPPSTQPTTSSLSSYLV